MASVAARKRSEASVETRPLPCGLAVRTQLGWIALFTSEKALSRIVLVGPDIAQLAAEADRFNGQQQRRQYDLRTSEGDAPQWGERLAIQLTRYAEGERVDFDWVPLAPRRLTAFQQKVLQQCRAIPYGETLTYGELAAKSGAINGARAVGNVMRQNETPLVIPCHRVVAAGGGLGGFSAFDGVACKKRLLELEKRESAV